MLVKVLVIFLTIQCFVLSREFITAAKLYEIIPNFKSGESGRSSAIVYGKNATRGDAPWQVLIFMDGKSLCGGSLISDVWILTAAHCIAKYTNFKILLGANNLTGFEDAAVTQYTTHKVVHPKYNKTAIANDIGLLKLPLRITKELAYVKPMRLPTMVASLKGFVNQSVTTYGWGRTSDEPGSGATSLQTTQLRVISNAECAQTFPNTDFNLTICCTGEKNTSICNGDSGSALVYKEPDGRWTQIGISSFVSSKGCTKGKPSAFTRVTKYLTWIAYTTGIKIL